MVQERSKRPSLRGVLKAVDDQDELLITSSTIQILKPKKDQWFYMHEKVQMELKLVYDKGEPGREGTGFYLVSPELLECGDAHISDMIHDYVVVAAKIRYGSFCLIPFRKGSHSAHTSGMMIARSLRGRWIRFQWNKESSIYDSYQPTDLEGKLKEFPPPKDWPSLIEKADGNSEEALESLIWSVFDTRYIDSPDHELFEGRFGRILPLPGGMG